MSSIQLSFSLRVSSGVKTVHLLGSWDNYVGQLPLAKDKSSKSGTAWKGTFKFQNSTLEAGKRYWYYYIIDGYHVAHNPSVESTTEPTTGRELNILDVTEDGSKSSHKSSSKSSSRHSSSKDKSSRHRASLTVDIPKGRPLSVSQIKAPKPMSPHATKHILQSDYEDLEELTARFGSAGLEDDVLTDFSTSPVSSNGSSLSYRSDSSSPSSSLSGYSTPSSDCSSCTCERYGITRKGERVKIDCGGSRCGYEDSSDCASDVSDDEEAEYEVSARRNGIIVG
ncbi:GTP-binding protein EsdC [Trichoderma harzianum]|uniref:GTP-binding protein EsdC n=1 Tax=Trichoderma harzianum TaxID=5544 RepID=A0A0F9XJY6_TRIHA|nr:GTP-binding protein EsdC [Trichoderma harzianum]